MARQGSRDHDGWYRNEDDDSVAAPGAPEHFNLRRAKAETTSVERTQEYTNHHGAEEETAEHRGAVAIKTLEVGLALREHRSARGANPAGDDDASVGEQILTHGCGVCVLRRRRWRQWESLRSRTRAREREERELLYPA